MVMTGIVKLWEEFDDKACQEITVQNSLDHPVQDFEEEAFLLIV